MKKKLALLLALTIGVSVVPMNVFGASSLRVPDRGEATTLPGSVVDILRLDLADLNDDLDDWTQTGESVSGTGKVGYPVRLELSEDAKFGLDMTSGRNRYWSSYSGLYLQTNNGVVGYEGRGRNDSFDKAFSFTNVKMGLWEKANTGYTAARAYVIDDRTGESLSNSQIASLNTEIKDKAVALVNKELSTEGPNKTAIKIATDYEYDQIVAKDKEDGTGVANGYISQSNYNARVDKYLSDGFTPVNESAKVVSLPVTEGTVTDAAIKSSSDYTSVDRNNDLWNGDIADWEDLEDYFGTSFGNNAVPYTVNIPVVVDYDFEITDDNEMYLFFRLYNFYTGQRIGLSELNLDPDEIVVNIAIPMYLDSNDWDAEISVYDAGDRSDTLIEGFPQRIIRDNEAHMSVDVNTTASFASTGFLDKVSLTETAFGFLDGNKGISTGNVDAVRDSSRDYWTDGSWNVDGNNHVFWAFDAALDGGKGGFKAITGPVSYGENTLPYGTNKSATYTAIGERENYADDEGMENFDYRYSIAWNPSGAGAGAVAKDGDIITLADFNSNNYTLTNTNTNGLWRGYSVTSAAEVDRLEDRAIYQSDGSGSYDSAHDSGLSEGYRNVGETKGTTRVVELKLDSDYARLVENRNERLKFQDYRNTFHDDTGRSGEAYDYVDFFGPDDKFDDVDYNFGYEVGNREINADEDEEESEFDLRFFFDGSGGLPGEAPTDVNNGSARYGSETRPDRLDIFNMMVAFDDRQKMDTDIDLMWRVYDIDTDDIDTTRDRDANRTYLTFDNDTDDDDWETADSIPVQRKDDVVMLDLLDDRLGAVVETPDKVVSGKFDAESTPFRISEVVNGTWDSAKTVIGVGQGVEITGAHVSVYEYEFDDYDTADRGDDGERIESTTYDINRNFGDDNYWTDDGDTGEDNDEYLTINRHQDFYNNGGIRVNNKEITIDPRFNTLTTSGERREVEVQLELSIEAGYAHKYGTTNIDVAFSGPGASNFEAPTFTIATVRDPITVQPVTPVTSNSTDWEVAGYEQVIGDITIVEAEAGDLEQNDELWLYVVGNNQTGLTLTAANQAVVTNAAASGLELYDGTNLRHQFGNFWLNGMRWNIRRSSGLGSASVGRAPAEIVFEDVTIAGQMFNNASYAIVISGDAVAENDYTVWSNSATVSNPADNDYNTWDDPQNRAGVFDGEEPYVIQAINWTDTTYTEPPTAAPPVADDPADTVDNVTVVGRNPKTFGPGSQSIDEQGNFYSDYMMALASNGEGFVGLSPRAFAEYIGGTTQYDEASRTATITGTDNNGAEVVLQLTLGSTNAVVGGQTVDIATYNGHPGYPMTSIMPFNSGDRIYLPARFLCKAFGVPFNYDDASKSLTLY